MVAAIGFEADGGLFYLPVHACGICPDFDGLFFDKAIERYQAADTGELSATLSSDVDLAVVLGRYTDCVKSLAQSQGVVVSVRMMGLLSISS